ncbi:MAG: M28 family peptidase [Chloroflexia bacterium]
MRWRKRLLALLLFLLLSCGGSEPFSGARAYRHVQAQLEAGYRIPGSEGASRVADYIVAQLRRQGWKVREQRFTYRGVSLRNVIGIRGEGPILLLGTHYDTRRTADQDPDPARRDDPVPGANDGATGVAVLLELARVLAHTPLRMQVWLAFFDGEDQGGIDGWPWSVGAAYLAQHLDTLPRAVVIVDMVGDREPQFFMEGNSHLALRNDIWQLAGELGYADSFTPTVRHTLIDDHIPFRQRGIPAVDIIDFDYPYWHTTADTADKVSPETLERVGRLLEAIVREGVGLGESGE